MKLLLTMIMAGAVLCPGAVAQTDDAAECREIKTEKIIGMEYPGMYKHPASICELENGDLYLSYYGGSGEYQDDSKVWGMRFVQECQTWKEPEVIADTPFLSEGNPVVWQAPDKVVWLFYVQRYGDTWSESRIKAKVSFDSARTWSDSLMIAWEKGMMVRGRPIVLKNEKYLLPIYHETGHDRENVGSDTTSLFMMFDPQTREWTETGRITSYNGNLQPAVVQLDDDTLIAYCRRGGGYGPDTHGYIIRSESHDGGLTWSEGKDSQFPNPNSAIDFLDLRNGHLLLVYNDSMSDRTPLTVAISTDNDATYPYRRNIGEGPNSFAYPMAIQTRDDKIHIIYTTNGRTQIMHAVFNESAIVDYEEEEAVVEDVTAAGEANR